MRVVLVGAESPGGGLAAFRPAAAGLCRARPSATGAMGELPERPKKIKLQEGAICWFCKQPGDDDAWRGLGKLLSTHEPIAE